MSVELDVLNASRGNEKLGVILHAKLQARPQPGIRSRIAHPEAALADVQYLGTSQMSGHYPGNMEGDPEDVAAALTMQWLGGRRNTGTTPVYDVHNNPAGLQFQEVGNRALRAGVAGAYLLGYHTCIVRPDPFYNAVPNATALESPATHAGEYVDIAKKLYVGLGEIAAMDRATLDDAYEGALPHMQFLRKYTVYPQPPVAMDEQSRVAPDNDTLAQLEALPSGPGLVPVALDSDLREALALPHDGEFFVGGWTYDTLSPVLPGTGSYNGEPRRLAIGSLYHEVAPPAAAGEWLTFAG